MPNSQLLFYLSNNGEDIITFPSSKQLNSTVVTILRNNQFFKKNNEDTFICLVN